MDHNKNYSKEENLKKKHSSYLFGTKMSLK